MRTCTAALEMNSKARSLFHAAATALGIFRSCLCGKWQAKVNRHAIGAGVLGVSPGNPPGGSVSHPEARALVGKRANASGVIHEAGAVLRVKRNVHGNHIKCVGKTEAVQGLLHVAFGVVNINRAAARRRT